jgi:hypothetical protein
MVEDGNYKYTPLAKMRQFAYRTQMRATLL